MHLKRRRVIGWTVGAGASVLLAACAPPLALAPGRPGRVDGQRPDGLRADGRPDVRSMAGEPSFGQGGQGGQGRPSVQVGQMAATQPVALTTPTPRLPEPRPTPTSTLPPVAATPTPDAGTPPRAGAGAGVLGRTYRVHADVSGTVRLTHCWDGARSALVEAWLADLGAICPKITVENDVADAGSMRERLVTALVSGAPPDVIMLRADSVAFFADQDALLPLDELMANDGIGADWFMPSELASRRWEGRTYGLPQVTAGAEQLLFVNTGMLARIGIDVATPIETWQDLDALVAPARKADLVVLDPTRMPAGSTAHQVWTYANGGRYWDDDLRQIGWADDAGREAAEWLLRFVKAQGGMRQLAGSSDGRAGGGLEARSALRTDEWGNGKAICCINGAGFFYDLQQQAQHLRYAAYDFPRNADNPASAGATPSAGGWMLSIPRASRQQEAAWELVKLATASVSACAFTARQRRPSPRAGCDQSFGLAGSQPSWPAISASLSQSVVVPVSPIQPRLEQIYREMQTELLQEQRAPRDVLEGSAREAQRLLDEWQATRSRA